MSWHKAKLSSSVVWIGWQFDFRTYTVRLEPEKLQRLHRLLHESRRHNKLPTSTLEKLTGKLLWLSNLLRAFRPSLAPLYQDQYCPPLVSIALSPASWKRLVDCLSDDLLVRSPCGLAAAPVSCRAECRHQAIRVACLSPIQPTFVGSNFGFVAHASCHIRCFPGGYGSLAGHLQVRY